MHTMSPRATETAPRWRRCQPQCQQFALTPLAAPWSLLNTGGCTRKGQSFKLSLPVTEGEQVSLSGLAFLFKKHANVGRRSTLSRSRMAMKAGAKVAAGLPMQPVRLCRAQCSLRLDQGRWNAGLHLVAPLHGRRRCRATRIAVQAASALAVAPARATTRRKVCALPGFHASCSIINMG